MAGQIYTDPPNFQILGVYNHPIGEITSSSSYHSKLGRYLIRQRIDNIRVDLMPHPIGKRSCGRWPIGYARKSNKTRHGCLCW